MRKTLGIALVILAILVPAVIAGLCYPSGGRGDEIAAKSGCPCSECTRGSDCGCFSDIADLYDAYWEIDTDVALGSGVAISSREILTAAHAVVDAHEIKVVRKMGGGIIQELEAEVEKIGDMDKGPDLALLRIVDRFSDVQLYHAQRYKDLRVQLGERAVFVGTPRGEHGMLEDTIVSKQDVKRGQQWLFAVNGRGWYGDSGGPVFVKRDKHWFLAGITVQLAWPGGKAPTLAVSPDVIDKFLDSMEGCK